MRRFKEIGCGAALKTNQSQESFVLRGVRSVGLAGKRSGRDRAGFHVNPERSEPKGRVDRDSDRSKLAWRASARAENVA